MDWMKETAEQLHKGAFLMVNGTTSAVQSMILSVCKAGDKIILPRNIHKSVINAMVLCGAIPVYAEAKVNTRIGIAMGVSLDEMKRAMDENPDAVAVFINNPTYYGVCSNLKAITELAHERGMRVLVDEAHGTHLYFGAGLPISAMAAGRHNQDPLTIATLSGRLACLTKQ